MYFGLELGPFLGISIGIPLFVILIAVILYFVYKRRQSRPGLVDVPVAIGPDAIAPLHALVASDTPYSNPYANAREASVNLRKAIPTYRVANYPTQHVKLVPEEIEKPFVPYNSQLKAYKAQKSLVNRFTHQGIYKAKRHSDMRERTMTEYNMMMAQAAAAAAAADQAEAATGLAALVHL